MALFTTWSFVVMVTCVAISRAGVLPIKKETKTGYSLLAGGHLYGSSGTYNSYFDPEYYRDECESQLLTCVPRANCYVDTPDHSGEGHLCPVNFVSHSGYCIFLSKGGKVRERSQAQVHDYCRRLGTRPFYFQSTEEWEEFLSSVKSKKIEMAVDKTYWTDAHWDDEDHRWEWRSTNEEIEWEKIIRGTNCYKENKEAIEHEEGCLSMSYDVKANCLRLRKIDCLINLPLICKAGKHKTRCAENKETVCCFSPTYEYFNLNKYGGPGSQGVHAPAKSECWVLLQGLARVVECRQALNTLGSLRPLPQPVRIESSYFYFTTGRCLGERRAVVWSREVHDFIVRYMMTEEVAMAHTSFIIGLRYEPEDDQFRWEDGKLDNFYTETFWADGQPDKKSGADLYSCVAYKNTGINAYSWHLMPSKSCLGDYTMNVCELPIRATSVLPTEKKLQCGQRLERGVLARGALHIDTENYNEALYGEFPWHAAVVQPKNTDRGVVMFFACSGALIHPEFVLTSAHCVVYSSGDFAVSLGEWDLSEGATNVLKTVLVTVNDVITHPGYRVTASMKHDIALLHLAESVQVNAHPQLGLGCLPFPTLFFQQSGAWECFTVGWPDKFRRKGYSLLYNTAYSKRREDTRILERIESEFMERRQCRSLTRDYYRILSSNKQEEYAYDKKYGYHHSTYEQHGYFDLKEPELICTVPYGSNYCLDDLTPILMCRQATIYTDDPFSLNDIDRGIPNFISSFNSRIVNALGKDRFDSEKWYVMGIGHNLNQCNEEGRGRNFQVFTPVHEYLSFIHSHLDVQYSGHSRKV
ncbi:uncharacterized protein [Procambarus clarkii]|uniref:uncharacterized protein n=1 Tax=Procambarus clarkii TaxID=6728 RepID=UPI001E6712B5|nr:uncharacterized protein LOC123773998 [Procambarus clarkii]